MISRHLTRATLAAACVFSAGAVQAQTIHDYEFTTGLTDAVPGGAALQPSFRDPATGSVSDGSYNFEQGAGLSLSSQLPGSTYTIDIMTTLNNVDGYRKLVSFNDLSSDLGLYILNGGLSLYNVAGSSSSNVIVAGSPFDVRLSRDGTDGLIIGFLNGVQQFSYSDTNNLFLATQNLYFLRDDTRQNGEDSGGSADFIRISDSAAGAPALPVASAVPEPAAWAMMILGMGAIGLAMRRRQKVATRVSCAA